MGEPAEKERVRQVERIIIGAPAKQRVGERKGLVCLAETAGQSMTPFVVRWYAADGQVGCGSGAYFHTCAQALEFFNEHARINNDTDRPWQAYLPVGDGCATTVVMENVLTRHGYGAEPALQIVQAE